MSIKVVWHEIKEKTFKGKDAIKQAEVFAKQLNQREAVEEVDIFAIDYRGNTVGYYDYEGSKFTLFEMDG